MFTERQLKILKLIYATPQGIFGSKIALALHVSDRTIRNEITQINAVRKGTCTIESSTKTGYSIASGQVDYLRNFLYHSREVEQSTENRLLLMFGMVVAMEDVDFYQLGELLYLSPQSVQREAYNLQRFLTSVSGMQALRIEKERLRLAVGEPELRELMLRIVKDEVQSKKAAGYTLLSDLLYKKYDQLEFEYLSLKVREFLEQQGVALPSDTLVLIVSAIYICLVRNTSGCTMPACAPPVLDNGVQELLDNLRLHNQPICNGDLPFLNGFLSTFPITARQQNNEEISPVSTSILDEFCADVLTKYGFDLRQSDELYANMLLHIEYMIRRIKSGYEVVNPIINSVKLKYPYAYEMSMLIVHIVYKRFGLYLRDDEISYLAIYLEHFMQNINQKLRCAIISSPQRSTTNILTKWLGYNFGNHLRLLDSIPLHALDDFVSNHTVDLIISSEMTVHPRIPSCMVSGIPDEQDQAQLWETIRKVRQDRRAQEIIKKNFCAAAICFYDDAVQFEQVIADLSHALWEQEKIADAQVFANDVLQRELNYPTALCESFMIPHPLFTFAKKTAIAAAVLRKPSNIAGNAIQLVFLLAIEPAHNDEVGVLFGLFKQLAHNRSMVKRLCETNSVESFLNGLIDFSRSV